MQQCPRWCDSTVDVIQLHCQSCDSAVDHVTALSHHVDSAVTWTTALSHERRHCHMIRQCCRWCDGAVVHVSVLSTWYDSSVNHETVSSLMWQHCQCHATALSIMLSHDWRTVMWSSAQSHAQRLCCAIDSKVIQRTVSSPNWQWLCCNCVSWFPFVLAYKTGTFVHTRFSSLNEQILLKLLVGVAPKIEANLKHLTDLIFLDLTVLTDSMVCSRFVSPQLFC